MPKSKKSSKSSRTSNASDDDSHKLISTLEPSQIAEFKEAFDLFDVNGNGSIGFTELQTCLTKMGFSPDPTEIHNMINEVDESGIDHQFLFLIELNPVSQLSSKSLLR